MKVNEEMNSKFNTYDHLDKLKCIEDKEILNLEKKFYSFSKDKNYDYALNIINSKCSLPNINLDLSKIIEFYKKPNNDSLDGLLNEISWFNKNFEFMTKYISLKKVETIKEKSIVYYLFYFLSRAFFYVIMSENFMVDNTNCSEYIKFFKNYHSIVKSAKLYLKKDIADSSMVVEEQNKENSKKQMVTKGIYEAFEGIKYYKDEFRDAIIHCQNFIILISFSISEKDPSNPLTQLSNEDRELISLSEIFIINLKLLYKVNKEYGIINYKNFYNDAISKNINIKSEFKKFLHNEKNKAIREREKKKGKEDKKKDKKEDKKDDKKEKEKEDEKEEAQEVLDELMDIGNDKKEKKEDKKEKYTKVFTLLDYIWLFNPAAKNEIIILFNDRQRKSEIIKSVNQARESRPPLLFGLGGILISSKDLFLMINVHRNNLIEDTLNEVSKPGIKLQNPIKVRFIGEQGVDEGGVRKEFFLLFIRQIFDPDYGMFNYNKKTRLYWFNHYTFEPKIKYELIGIIFGLAIYNNIILDVKFPLTVYKKLLGIKPTLEDMKECDPELYNNFTFLINSKDKNLKEELDTNFIVVDDKFGEKLDIPLKPNGENIMVDSENKDEYVELYLDWYFNKSIKEGFNSFEKGFYKVFNRDLCKILSPEELELIICGTQFLDFNELKKVCNYEEYTKDSETIKYFWEILLEFNEEEKKKFLSFVTGCDRAPIDGLGSLSITISNGGTDLNQLPSAHTCFNNLILPDYRNKEVIKKKIHIAINYSEGFGLI